MAGDRVKLEVSERTELGTRNTKRLRREGLVPGVLYGQETPRAIAVPERELRRALTGPSGLHAVMDVAIAGAGSAPAILKDYQRHPIHGRVTHVDLQQVRLDQPIHASVVVNLVGDPAGVSLGGVLTQVTREVHVEALPMEVPEHLDVDVSGLGMNESLRLADVSAPQGVTFLDDPEETVLASVAQPTRVEEPEVTTEAEETVSGVPQGDQQPQGGAEAPLEPGADAAGSPGTVSG